MAKAKPRVKVAQPCIATPKSRVKVAQSRIATPKTTVKVAQPRIATPKSRVKVAQPRIATPKTAIKVAQPCIATPKLRVKVAQPCIAPPKPRVTVAQPRIETSPKPRVTVAQLRVLLEAIESDPSLYNAGRSMITFLNVQKWLDLTDKLNESFDGAQISAQSWKYVLRYWSENTKKKMEAPKKRRSKKRKCKKRPPKTIQSKNTNLSITAKEGKELTILEKRLLNFMKKEDSKKIDDVTSMGKPSEEPKPYNTDDSVPDDGIKFVAHLLNVFPAKQDENTCPGRARKRTIFMKDNERTDPAVMSKKFKVIFDQNVDGGEPQKQILEHQLDRLQFVSRELEDHISSIQSRIHVIKDLWKHSCII